MGHQLTYADRELLLQTFDTLKTDWDGEDEQLLAAAHDWAKRLVPSCGFEHSLARDAAVLSRYLLTHSTHQDLADIARGGLLYLIRGKHDDSSKLGDLGLLDDAFISSYAVHEIRTRLGEPTVYNPPRLTQNEQEHAENLFLELAESPILDDEELVGKSRVIRNDLGNLAACGLFQRLQRNIDFLISVIATSDRSGDHKCFARAALSYLVCEEDAIDDRLGIVGYLDDNFIAEMAVDLIDPGRDPWLDILDATVAAWPFLNALVIDDGSEARPISEFMIINSALSCAHLRGDGSASTVLILPFAGPTPFLVGFVATLGFVQDSGQLEVTEDSFFVGQKVLVDNCAIAEFAGVEEISGRRMFGLTQHRRHEGQSSRCTHFWPISGLRRLVPAEWSRATRGQLTYDLSNSDVVLPALEYLFNASKAAHLVAVSKETLVVTAVTAAHDLAKRLRLHGYPLKDVIPMGHLVDNKVRLWSSRFGQQEPLLVFVSDLDAACVYAEENPEAVDLVIIDVAGRNAGKTASLAELTRLNLRTIVMIPERDASELSIANDDAVDLWEWDIGDFSSLLWPQSTTTNGRGVITHYERRLQSQSSAAPRVTGIESLIADEVFESIRQLKSLAKRRGEDPLIELDELVALAFGVMSLLVRSATPMADDVPSFERIEQRLNKMDEIQSASIYMSAQERSVAVTAQTLLSRFFEELKVGNPKADFMRDMLGSHQGLTVICPDSRLVADLEFVYEDEDVRVLSHFDDLGDPEIEEAVIPGWFGKSRMAKLLAPPVAQSVHLVLYNIERRWYELFRREQKEHRMARVRRHGRSTLFPGLKGWSEQTAEPPETGQKDDPILQELEAIQEHVRSTYRQRAYRDARSDGSESEVSARLVLFEGEAYAFLRESYKANVVTHLIDAVIEDMEDADIDVKRKTVKELKAGDALLFHRRTDRDVIRMAADEELADGARETATLWQKALSDYAKRESMKSKEIWRRLKHEGCPLHYQTVRGWLDDTDMIAPRQYDRDVRIVARVTGDRQLNDRLEAVLDAISSVFGAHQRASHKLAREVLGRAVEILKEESRQSDLIEIGSDIVLARVVEIDDSETQVRVSMVNRLQESD